VYYVWTEGAQLLALENGTLEQYGGDSGGGTGSFLGRVDYSAQDQSWLPTGGTVGEGATCVAFNFEIKTVLHGIYNGVSWNFTAVPVNYGDYYLCDDTLTSENQFLGQRSIVVWTGVEGQYFVTFPVDKYLVLDGMYDQPISVMRDHIDENGIFMFHAVGCSWDMHSLSSLDFTTLTPAVKHIYDTSLGRNVVIDPGAANFYIEGISAEGGMTSIIKNNVPEFPDDTSFPIGGAAFVMAENFVGFKPEDFVALDPYIHFTRPFVRIDTFSEIYRDFNTAVLTGFRKQQQINDLQTALLLEKVDDIRVENVSIPVVNGRADMPISSPTSYSINPLYVNHWPDIAALNEGTTVTDYVDLAAEPQVSLGFFAHNVGTSKVAIPTLRTFSRTSND
jgi:hypothetical protein